MATKPEAEASEGEAPKAGGKSKKLLIIVAIVVVVLIAVGAGAFFYISKQRAAAAAAEGEEAPAPVAAHAPAGAPPVYLPLETMVVNLADPGGEKVAQVGITLEVRDAHASDSVKAYLPTLRSAILMLISQRTAEELLSAEGKQKLAQDILDEAAVPFGGGSHGHAAEEAPAGKKPKTKAPPPQYPVVKVLFSSFIVQ